MHNHILHLIANIRLLCIAHTKECNDEDCGISLYAGLEAARELAKKLPAGSTWADQADQLMKNWPC